MPERRCNISISKPQFDSNVPTDLKIVAEEKTFRVVDGRGTHYGPVVSSSQDAEQLLDDWRNYYASPLG